MNTLSIPKSATDSNPRPYSSELSSKLDVLSQEEEQHAEAAVEHFIEWKRHLQAASIARAERRALEADIWAGQRAA